MTAVSIFKNYSQWVENKNLDDIINDIQSGKQKAEIETIRSLITSGQNDNAAALKNKLPAFTVSGNFENGRKATDIVSYSNFLVLDLDKLSAEQVENVQKLVKLAHYTYAAFISPSGNGMKIIVQVNSSVEHHKEAFKQVADHYEKCLNLEIDSSGSDVSRLCFMSYDPDCYFNKNADVFDVALPDKAVPVLPDENIQTTKESPLTGSFDTIFQTCIEFTNNKLIYTDGNRNNYIHLLACNCNRKGIPENETEALISQNFDLDHKEVHATVKSAYINNAADFAKFAVPADLQNVENESQETEDYLKTTPTIPLEAINLMPDLFREGAKAFESDPRRRDVFLTSALCIISGCLPQVQGVYHQERVYPHLFSFIIAPAASGKGVLKNAKRLGDKIHERMIDISKKAKVLYDNEMLEYKANLNKRKKEDPIPEKPEEPHFKLLFIPADCSQAMMMQILQDNDGKGIICESEADAMSGANKQDWGNYSHIMRAAFQHEKVSAARKTNREIIEIKEPKLAVSLSGTPAQVPKLIASAEDGLFSRFIFYAYKNEIVWQDPSPKSGGIIYTDHFESLSDQVLEIFDFLNKYPTEIFLTQDQWDKLNLFFQDKLNDVTIFTGEDAASLVFRLGLILYRFCMIFTSLRKFENGDCSNDVTCTDDDFTAALMISDVFLQHSLLMFNNLSRKTEPLFYKMPNNKKRLLEQLPGEFQRKEAVALGLKLGLSERSVDDFLKNSCPSILERIKTGVYRKI